MSKRPADLLTEDMWEAVEKIERYVAGLSQKAFEADDKCVDAVVRNLEIVGEAANRLPDDFKATHPDIEWNKIVGLRHRIVHGYFGLDLEIVWQILRRDLPRFKTFLARIRQEEGTAAPPP